jgi:hypothetical protein
MPCDSYLLQEDHRHCQHQYVFNIPAVQGLLSEPSVQELIWNISMSQIRNNKPSWSIVIDSVLYTTLHLQVASET